jgi:hypothetical protein
MSGKTVRTGRLTGNTLDLTSHRAAAPGAIGDVIPELGVVLCIRGRVHVQGIADHGQEPELQLVELGARDATDLSGQNQRGSAQ